MKILITEIFMKNLPKEKKETILEKVDLFINELQKNNNEIKNIPNSYSVRKIKGNDKIFKFRVDMSNRVLFTFASKVINIRESFKVENSLIILDYCNHDNQIKRAKNLKINVTYFNIHKDEIFEELIDNNYKTYYYSPNEVITRIVDNKTLLNLIKEDEKNAIYYLNEDQEECLRPNLNPLFLFGSAGSGKTTVGVNKIYFLYKSQNINIGYFTYSKLLMNEIKLMFEYMCSQNGKSDFNSDIDFNYLSKYLYNSSNKIRSINFLEFKDWFYDSANRNSKVKKLSIDVFDIYKEIRGIIKGLVGINWMPHIEFKKTEYCIDTLEYLQNKKFVTSNKHTFSLNTNVDIIKKILKDNKIENKFNIFNDLDKIQFKIDQEIINQKIIDKNIYLNLPNEYSIYSKVDRIVIYDIAFKYQEWLNKNNLYDENDITRIVLKNLRDDKIKKYDFILVDEIQDLTEIQIYLMYKLVNNPLNILFSGDFNQTINPTFFNTTRIETLFFSNAYDKFYKKVLDINYRSCSDIVALSNKITNLRIENLYKNKRNDYIEKAIRESTSKPFLLNQCKDNKKKLLDMVKDRHYVAILVCDEEDKVQLKYEYGIEESVFTLNEIKGIEKDYVICLNIVSKYKEKWDDILNGVIYDNHSLYRYYFNMIYVAVTRAREYICFYEDEKELALYKEIKDYIQNINTFNEDELKFDYISDDDDYFNEGQYLEYKEKYEQAIFQYSKSKSKNVSHCTKRCEALLLKENGKYSEAGAKLLKLKEYTLASECYMEVENYTKLLKCYVLSNKPYELILSEFKELEADPLQIVLKSDIKELWIRQFYLMYENYIEIKINKNKQNIDYINETLKILKKRYEN